MKYFYLIFLIVTVPCCIYGGGNPSYTRISKDDELTTQDTDTIKPSKTLNEIRFEGWEREDWLDNDYIRALRKYLDEYNQGSISNPDLDPYREQIQGKFIIGDIQPALLGGAFIQIIFIDMPDRIFCSQVYSDVDEATETVTNYHVRYIRIDEKPIDCTKEDILQTVQEYPELKLW